MRSIFLLFKTDILEMILSVQQDGKLIFSAFCTVTHIDLAKVSEISWQDMT